MALRRLIPIMPASVLIAACISMTGGSPVVVEAILLPTGGGNVTGRALFSEIDGGVLVEVEASGLKRGGHGLHVHEKGDCAAPGDHLNPSRMVHAHPDKPEHHLGDLPMLVADTAGNARLSTIVLGPTVTGKGRTNITGRAVIVHAAPDDYFTQPDGNAGAPLACGVIIAK